MAQIEVYLKESFDGYQKGALMTVDEAKAEKWIEEGNAVKVSYAPLNESKARLDALFDEKNTKLAEINSDDRLTDLGKNEKIEEVEAEYDAKISPERFRYQWEIEQLKKKAKERMETETRKPIGKEIPQSRLNYELGTFLAKLDREASKPSEAVSILEDELETMMPEVAQELLGKYFDVKSMLEGKINQNEDFAKKYGQKTSISTFFNKLEEKTKSESESAASIDYDILTQIEKQGDYTPGYQSGRELARKAMQQGKSSSARSF